MNRDDIRAAILSYLGELDRLTSEALHQQPGSRRLRDIVEMAMNKQAPRSGTLASGTDYYIHGIGFRFTRPDGTELEVDTDFFNTGARIFDPWRIAIFIETELGNDPPNLDQIRAACDDLASEGLLQKQGNWYLIDLEQSCRHPTRNKDRPTT